MQLIIVRHGDPNYALDTLTRKGVREARLLAERLSGEDITAFYCSPLGRAKKTASYTLKKMKRKAEICDFLQEFRGTVEHPQLGTTHCWDRLPSYWTAIDDYYSHEKWQGVDLMQSGNVPEEYKRVCLGIDEILARHGYSHKGRLFEVTRENHDTILLFCHFGVECAILSHIMSVSPMIFWHNFVALPTSVTVLQSQEREKGKAIFVCSSFGDLSHLYKGREPASFSGRWCECFSDKTRH